MFITQITALYLGDCEVAYDEVESSDKYDALQEMKNELEYQGYNLADIEFIIITN